MLPVDWRERFTAAVRGEGEIDPGLFEARPLLAPERQVQIYQEQYRLRLDEACLEELPGLARLLGEEHTLELSEAWLRAHPPRTWTLADVATGFADWLEAQGAPPGHVDMARLDAAVSRGFTAAEPGELLTTELTPQLRLRLSPPTCLLRLRSNAHQVRLALLTDVPPPALHEADVPLAIYRGIDLQMRHLEIEPGLWGLLSALPASVEAAVEAALQDAAESGLPIDGARLTTWFSTAAQRRLVEASPGPAEPR